MNKGYIENGFIIDLSDAAKVSEIIYELSRILDMPESKNKYICLKLGAISLSTAEIKSIQALIDVMDSKLEFISTSSTQTLESATELGVKISEFTTNVEAPTFVPQALENELDNIFGEEQGITKIETTIEKVVEPTEEETVLTEPDDDEISPVVRNNDTIAQQVEKQEIKDENDEDIISLKNEPEELPTLYLRKTIRSGQSISSDGNIIVIGDINPGAEIIAKGDITVWGVLGGIAHAGSDGNNYAIIRALKLNPVQIRIGEVFARRPDTVNIPYVQKTSEYIPEEAFTYKGNIVIRKIHEEVKEK